MGGSAFFLLMVTEINMAHFVFHRPFSEIFAGYQTLVGILGLTGQMIFGLLPLIV